MATEVISTLSTRFIGNGNNYETFGAWQTAQARDLVAADEYETLIIYDDWPSGLDSRFESSVAWAGDATHYVTMKAADGEEAKPDGTGVWVRYVPDVVNGGIFWFRTGNLTPFYLQGFGIELPESETDSSAIYTNANTSFNIYMDNLILLHNGVAEARGLRMSGNVNGHFRNSLVLLPNGSSGTGVYAVFYKGTHSGGTFETDNITAICNGGTIALFSGSSTMVSPSGLTFRNNTLYGGAVDNTDLDASGVKLNNATSSATAFGTDPIINLPETAFVDYNAGDYRARGGEALDGSGLDLSTDFTLDLNLDTRTVPWSRGAYIAVTTGVVPPTVDGGGPYTGSVNTPAQLDGTVTPGDDPAPTLLWTEPSGLGGTFSDDTIADPTFTPTATGAYTLRLTATPNDTTPVFDDAGLTSEAELPHVDSVNGGNPIPNGSSYSATGSLFTGQTGSTLGGTAQADFVVNNDTSVTQTHVRGDSPYGEVLTYDIGGGVADATTEPQADWDYVNIVELAAQGVINTTPPLKAGDQVAWDTLGGTVVVLANGSAELTSGNPPVTFSAEVHDGSSWGAAGDITLVAESTPVAFTGNIANQTVTQAAPVSIPTAQEFSGSFTPFTFSATGLPAGMSIQNLTGILQGTPTTPEVASNCVVTATDTDTNTAQSNTFTVTVEAATSIVRPYTYPMNEGAGSVLNNTNPETIGTGNGTWNDALDWTSIPVNSRYYPVNEGTGATVADTLGDGSTDGTIQNYTDNWT